jgi:hypothetical protein
MIQLCEGVTIERVTTPEHGSGAVKITRNVGAREDAEVISAEQWAAAVASVAVHGGGQYVESIAHAVHCGG